MSTRNRTINEWDLADRILPLTRRAYLYGPAGCGKSAAALSMRGQFWAQITLNEDLSVQELTGFYQPDGNVFRWVNGPIVSTMLDGGLLVVNEVDRASRAVQDLLLAVLDDAEVACITLPSRERISPAPGFRVVATSNQPPTVLEPALRSRFEVELEVKTPHPGLIARLNAQLRGLGDVVLDSYSDQAERALDPRKVLSFAKLLSSGLPAADAATAALGAEGPDFCAVLRSRKVLR